MPGNSTTMLQIQGIASLVLTAALISILSTTGSGAETLISLDPIANYVELEVNPGEAYLISITNISSDVAFSILQANAYLSSVTLSYNNTLIRGYHANGTNIGLVIFTNDSIAYLQNLNTDPVYVLLGLQVYDSNAPIPGACNMEQSIQIAPFLPTSYSLWMLTVIYPPASWPLDVTQPTCDGARLQYDIYHFHLPEGDTSRQTYFDSIRLMSTWKSIEKHSKKVIYRGQPMSQIEFANYMGTGTIVAVVVRGLTSSAAYVPAATYGCTVSSNSSPCTLFPGILDKVLAACILFLGFFLTLFGHRFFKCQAFLLGFCLASIITTSVLFLLLPRGIVNIPLTITALGVVGGLSVLGIWTCFGAPIVPVFLGSLILGILFSSIVMYTPLVDFSLFRDDVTFWLVFCIMVLCSPLIFISFPVVASIIISSMIGSYLFIFILCQYFGSNLDFVILNFLRRATHSSFGSAIIDPPYQSPDLAFALLWLAVAAGGMIFQIRRERDHTRAPFPPPPAWPTWLTLAKLRELKGSRQTLTTSVLPTETTPLIS